MTLGTNATLEERLKYAPDEITPDEIAKVLEELEDDIARKDRDIEALEEEVTLKDSEIEGLEFENAKLEVKINNLENFVGELEDQLQERP